MAARVIKSLQQGSGKNRRHREHKAAKTRTTHYHEQKEKRVRSELKRQDLEASNKAALKALTKEFNNNREFRKIKLIMGRQKHAN